MGVNDYISEHVRVYLSERMNWEPDIVTTPFDEELFFGRRAAKGHTVEE
jgi:hypothetical protein